MCGRHILSATPVRINAQFSVTVDPKQKSRYNIAPGSSGPRPINACSETVASKPVFKGALSRRRCILPADGICEWQKLAQGKQS